MDRASLSVTGVDDVLMTDKIDGILYHSRGHGKMERSLPTKYPGRGGPKLASMVIKSGQQVIRVTATQAQ